MSSLAGLFMASLLAMKSDIAFENTNIVTCDEQSLADSNRLRADITLQQKQDAGLAAKLILDNNTRYRDTPALLANKSSIYRAYLEYRGEKHYLVLGRQRVPFGVGRIWNPIDVFNPINSLAIEPGERPGTEAVHYEYAINELSSMQATASREKYAVRLKGYLRFADFALVGVSDNDQHRDILGWEFSGELLDTGIELRSEGGSFYDRQTGQRHTEFIGGMEYGFTDSVTVLGEYYFNDQGGGDQLGARLSWQPGPLWTWSLLPIINLADGSYVIAPAVEYSLSDEMTLSGGAFFYHGKADDALGGRPDLYYLRWFVHF